MTRFVLTDCHCHLQDDRFDHDLPEVMARAELVGVRRFVCNGSAPSDWEKTVQIAKDYPNVLPCLGLHPLHIGIRDEGLGARDWLDLLCEIIVNTKLTTSQNADETSAILATHHSLLATHPAIGEIGLDHYVLPRDDVLQESVFREQLRLATRLGKPVMLHTRHSLDRVLEIRSEKFVEIPVFLLHGFGSSTERVDKIVSMGGYFSFSANILKNHHKKMRHAAATVPLERVLLESDAPDMPPPHLYPRNEPAVLPEVLGELAKLRGMPMDDLAAVIAENEAAFFKKW